MSSRQVREALVASVACTRPPVSRHSRNESIVPKASSPRSARWRAPGTRSRIQAILVAEKYGIEQQAGLLRDHRLVARPSEPLHRLGGAPVLPDDGVVDRPAGRPLPHDHRLALVGDADAGNGGAPTPRPWRARRARWTRPCARCPRDRARPSRSWDSAARTPPARSPRPRNRRETAWRGSTSSPDRSPGCSCSTAPPLIVRFCRSNSLRSRFDRGRFTFPDATGSVLRPAPHNGPSPVDRWREP